MRDSFRFDHWCSWNVKPLFGLAFDTLPIFGYHFKSYLILWGTIGTAAYGLVAAIPNAMSNAVFTLCMWAGMNAVVWNDGMRPFPVPPVPTVQNRRYLKKKDPREMTNSVCPLDGQSHIGSRH